MRVQGKTQPQAECAVRFLTKLGYSPVERFQILSANNYKINLICFFASLWPIIIALILMLILAYGIYKFLWTGNGSTVTIGKNSWFSK